MADLVVVKSKIKDHVRNMNVSGDFAKALDKKVKELIRDAQQRAKANNRRTVMAKDL